MIKIIIKVRSGDTESDANAGNGRSSDRGRLDRFLISEAMLVEESSLDFALDLIERIRSNEEGGRKEAYDHLQGSKLKVMKRKLTITNRRG